MLRLRPLAGVEPALLADAAVFADERLEGIGDHAASSSDDVSLPASSSASKASSSLRADGSDSDLRCLA